MCGELHNTQLGFIHSFPLSLMLGLGPLNHLCFGVWVVFCGQLLCQRQKVCSAWEIQAAVKLFVICIPDFSPDNFCLSPRWKEEPFPCAAGCGGEASTAPSCWQPEPNPAIYSSPTCSHYTSLSSCASLVCSEPTALPQGAPFPVGSATPSLETPHTPLLCRALDTNPSTESWASPVKFLHITLAPKLTWIALLAVGYYIC